jgi:TctA family transporter
MELLGNLVLGFGVAVSPVNLLFCFVGTLLGTLIGVLPGIGPLGAISMLLPITFQFQPVTALIMLAGLYYGAQYGGSTTAILVNLPGETSAIVTCLDGHQMAKNGRGGAALAVAAMGSFFAGCVSTLLIAVASPPLARLGTLFQAPDYFSLMVLGLIGAVVLAHGSVVKALGMILLGLLLGLVGTDLTTGRQRYTFGIGELSDGIGFVTLAMGLFGVADILVNLERGALPRLTAIMGRLWPTREELRRAAPAVMRGTVLGSLLGVLPGGGAILSSFTAYALEKKISRHPGSSARGDRGVAGRRAPTMRGPDGFIPMLTLASSTPDGPPGRRDEHFGVVPGRASSPSSRSLFWGLVASMWIGNAMLLVINLPLIGLWVQMLRIPYRLLHPIILLLCCIGVYSLNGSALEVGLMALFGLLGYALLKLGFEPAPMLLGFVLGPMMEENLRRALAVSRGDASVFITRPISAVLLAISAMLLIAALLPKVSRVRQDAFQE